jgi:8-oxo-dGTP pyrophosphatase MutT (NUDIX family)/phosphohistidine phosphatase SixA
VPDAVRAGGAVLWRPAGDGREICVVHRPAYDDWSLPKGKLDPGEHPLSAAVREVVEETGVRGTPQLRLPAVSYTLPSGAPKTVEFWLMRATGAPAVPVADPAEVDAVAWLSPAAAAERLSYPADRDQVAYAAALPPVTAVTALVRHAHAGQRRKWAGPDGLRPIDPRGQAEADRLADVLSGLDPVRLIAATPLRCKQTLEPLAARVHRPIVSDTAFAEPDDPGDIPARVKAAAARMAEVRDEGPVVICSQGKVMPPLLALLDGADDPEPYHTPKGSAWLLSWSGGRLAALTRL